MSTVRDDEDLGQARPPEYAQARQRLERQRKFRGDLVAYAVINAFLVVVWAVTGAGYFWPVWVLGGWGIGLVLHAWDVFVRRPVTEADIDVELRRHSGGA